MVNVKLLVATHKKYEMPSDDIYFPLQVGRKGKDDIGFTSDDTGENISSMNSRLCELTGVYWAWKNLDAEYIGLVHYRRHFTKKPAYLRLKKNKFPYVLSKEELLPILEKYDLVLPRQRKYYIESIQSHFVHLPYTYGKDIQILREAIRDMAPDYLDAFDAVMRRSHAHMFNMFILRYDLFCAYCEWLFPILFEADKRIDTSRYTPMETRVVAYFGEFMIDVWNEKQKIPYAELPVMFMEKQNWLIKGSRFIWRKLFPKSNNGGQTGAVSI